MQQGSLYGTHASLLFLGLRICNHFSMDIGIHIKFPASGREEVSALYLRPQGARWLLVLAHGAGAGMKHPFMEQTAGQLAHKGIATFRYQFPYMERNSRRPDPTPVLVATVRAAISAASSASCDLPLLAGGKSLGGRMTSLAAAERPLPLVRGLVFFGFPLHPAGKPGTERAKHLAQITLPMLFLQGTRDKLADLGLLRSVCSPLKAKATLRVVDGADHSFHVLKNSGRSDPEVLADLAEAVVRWTTGLN
jgi:predicted alpha/beta-hydrolase family hydrolase